MEIRKLYYENCLLREFTAVVQSCVETKNGYEIILDSTVFYPEGGGQPCDFGTLEDAKVLDVREREETVVHLCDKPLPVGKQVVGKLDWDRRLDLMQQHSGEHIVSGIINRKFGAHNVGFHMGAETVTIDFDCFIPAEALAQIEKEANDAIYENIPVNCWYPPQEELPNVLYRSKKALNWPVRIVEVPGYDRCACCGVHVAHTGQIGIIKLLSCIKFHQGVRIEMLCGARAFSYLSRIYEQNRLVSQTFSAKPLETGAAAQRMNETLAAEKFRATNLERQVFDGIAQGYAGKGNVLHFAELATPGTVRELADRIAGRCGGTAAVFSGNDKDGYNLCLVDHTSSVAELGKKINENLDGRGGGKPGFFQGSAKASKDNIETFFVKLNQFYTI